MAALAKEIVSSSDRLREIALKAMVAYADDTEATIESIWRQVQRDASLMVALFELEKDHAIRALLYRTRSEIAGAAAKGELRRLVEKKAAVVVMDFRKRELAAAKRRDNEDKTAQAKADREYAEYLAQWRATPIGRMEIGGTPVWQLTAGTVRTWLAAEGQRNRCLELLIKGLPDDGRPIEYYRKPSEVAELWERAGSTPI